MLSVPRNVFAKPDMRRRCHHSCLSLRDPAAGLRSLYEFVQSSVVESNGGGGAEEQWGPPVLLVDDVSVLLSLGVRVGAVLDFSHYCRATVCSQLQVCISSNDVMRLSQPDSPLTGDVF